MKINFDRICRLAGVESGSQRRARLTEGTGHGHHHDNMKNEKHGMYHEEDETVDHMKEMEEYAEGIFNEDDDDDDAVKEIDELDYNEAAHQEEGMMQNLDEVVEVDPRILMEEIRRAKKLKLLRENRARQAEKKKERLQENHLKRVIRQEIQNIMSEIHETDSSWVYGEDKPRHSRAGYTNQGRTIPGIGFKKKW